MDLLANAKALRETRLAVEDFVNQEAAYLDAWDLDNWLTLFAEECRYEVAPTSVAEPFTLDSATTLFLIGDNRERLEQRVLRLSKPTAHVEFPKSRTRHLFTNVRILEDNGEDVVAMLNFCTFRTKNTVTTHYPGSARYVLQRSGASFLIKSKRIALDLENLRPQGKVSIIL